MIGTRRSTNRFNTSIWPGFVDAMTGLLLVLMFVLTIFAVLQFSLREQISGQESELDKLNRRAMLIARELGLEQHKTKELQAQIGSLRTGLAAAEDRAASQQERILALLAEQSGFQARISDLESEREALMDEQAALNLAIARAREETDAQAEQARLAAARREALEALVADLRSQNAANKKTISNIEIDRLAAQELRKKLDKSNAELDALTLALEEKRKEAEDTLTLLAAAQNAAKESEQKQLTESERQAALLAIARQELTKEQDISAEAQRQVALLNENVAALRQRVAELQGVIDLSIQADAASDVQIENLSRQLNQALARAASENARRLELEEAERKRLEARAKDLENYRSEFFGELRRILAGQSGVRIEGDRFVFSSEVLFDSGQAVLSEQGKRDVAQVATLLRQVAINIPDSIDWIIRVDGHTDDVPLSAGGQFTDNWELSQARALSVVRYLVDTQGISPNRLSANGFAEYQPINRGTTSEARSQNRRIELKLTER